jgi:hypothetical protein
MNTILTIAINQGTEPFLQENSRQSFIDAANRWGCDYTEITKNNTPYHPTTLKLMIFDLCKHDRIFLIDADAIIRKDAPNIFDLTDPKLFYAVKNYWDYFEKFGYRPREDIEIAHREFNNIKLRKNLDPTLNEDYICNNFFNSGVQVVSREYHSEIYPLALSYCLDVPLVWWDQMPINIAVYTIMKNYTGLSLEWNWRFPESTNKMSGFVDHYAGNPERYRILKNVDWKNY